MGWTASKSAPKGVHTVKKRLADGTVKEYRYPRRKKAEKVTTMGDLEREYLQNERFTELRKATQRGYRSALRFLEPQRDMPVAEWRRKHVIRVIDKLRSHPATANAFITVIQQLGKLALDMELVEFNPAKDDIGRLRTGERDPWPDAAVEAFLAVAEPHMRLAMVLAVNTGQRRGDLLALTWAQYDGEALTLRQIKTGEPIYLPVLPELKEALDAARKAATSVYILTNKAGQPIPASTFDHNWKATCRKAGLGKSGLQFHGLRHTAAIRFAEAGLSTHEIASLTGHKSLAQVRRYTKRAEQKRLAEGAVAKILKFRGKPARKPRKLSVQAVGK